MPKDTSITHRVLFNLTSLLRKTSIISQELTMGIIQWSRLFLRFNSKGAVNQECSCPFWTSLFLSIILILPMLEANFQRRVRSILSGFRYYQRIMRLRRSIILPHSPIILLTLKYHRKPRKSRKMQFQRYRTIIKFIKLRDKSKFLHWQSYHKTKYNRI